MLPGRQLLTMTLFLLHRWWLILVEFANIVNSTNVSTNIETAVLSNLNRWWLYLGEYASYKLWPSLGSVFPPRAPTPLLLIKLPRKWVFAACLRDLHRSVLISFCLSSTNTDRPLSTNVRSTTLIKYNQSKSFQNCDRCPQWVLIQNRISMFRNAAAIKISFQHVKNFLSPRVWSRSFCLARFPDPLWVGEPYYLLPSSPSQTKNKCLSTRVFSSCFSFLIACKWLHLFSPYTLFQNLQ